MYSESERLCEHPQVRTQILPRPGSAASGVEVEVKKRLPDGSYIPADDRDFATADFDAELEAAEAKLPGLWVCGNYRSGVAFPDCVKFGYDHAEKVLRFLAANPDGAAASGGASTESVAREASSPVAA